MALITLICPHCGGNFELDKERNLQPFLTCPYCGNRSLMQKNEDHIRLRGILSGKAQTPSPGATLPTETAAQAPGDIWNSDKASQPVRPLEEMIAEAQTDLADKPAIEPEMAGAPALPIKPVPAAETAAAVKPVEIVQPQTENLPEKPTEDSQPAEKQESASPVVNGDDIDRLCKLAEEAAEKHDLPLFNAYSRQALDCQPKDPRMYALRAALTEDADGFARATWTCPTWPLLTPRRKQSVLAQHLYNLNTALRYSRPERQHELVNQFAWQLVRQAIDFFTEQAELRCSQNLFIKTFKGRFHRSDLRSAVRFIEAVQRIDHLACPLCWQDLHEAIRKEIKQAPPRIARKLRHL
jgi:DNA-directed RNA polymerase subunit RPC12/RpoP